MEKFTKKTTNELWAYLNKWQQEEANNDSFCLTLPNRSDCAVYILLQQALLDANRNLTIVYENGVFKTKERIYSLYEILAESPQFQVLEQHLTELVQWIVS
jgi:hypothetical protein